MFSPSLLIPFVCCLFFRFVFFLPVSHFLFSHYSSARFRDKNNWRTAASPPKLMKEQMSNNKKQHLRVFTTFSRFYTEHCDALIKAKKTNKNKKKALGLCAEMNAAVLLCLMSQPANVALTFPLAACRLSPVSSVSPALDDRAGTPPLAPACRGPRSGARG